ncbi:MAG TPA: YvcK family protein [Dehalococcoidia bacterium]|nr:YvcK family protein [Dehalococcoidia bacterium]
MVDDRKSIVIIGGGSGSSVALRGLKTHNVDLTVVVTMFDSGGSTGILREEFGYPPLGDIRQCLVALSPCGNEQVKALNSALDFRFDSRSSLKGHSVGNLVLAALTTVYHGVQGAVDELSRMMQLQGQVVPVTLDEAHLCARLIDGEVIRTESAIDLRGNNGPGISEIFLDAEVKANPRALEAIEKADAILLGPGDLYTSVLPNLLVKEVSDAINDTKSPVIYACNLMTKLGETAGYGVSTFASEVIRYIGGRKLDHLLVDNTKYSPEVLNVYAAEDAAPVKLDNGAAKNFAHRIMVSDLAYVDGLTVRHNSERLAGIVLAAIEQPPTNPLGTGFN